MMAQEEQTQLLASWASQLMDAVPLALRLNEVVEPREHVLSELQERNLESHIVKIKSNTGNVEDAKYLTLLYLSSLPKDQIVDEPSEIFAMAIVSSCLLPCVHDEIATRNTSRDRQIIEFLHAARLFFTLPNTVCSTTLPTNEVFDRIFLALVSFHLPWMARQLETLELTASDFATSWVRTCFAQFLFFSSLTPLTLLNVWKSMARGRRKISVFLLAVALLDQNGEISFQIYKEKAIETFSTMDVDDSSFLAAWDEAVRLGRLTPITVEEVVNAVTKLDQTSFDQCLMRICGVQQQFTSDMLARFPLGLVPISPIEIVHILKLRYRAKNTLTRHLDGTTASKKPPPPPPPPEEKEKKDDPDDTHMEMETSVANVSTPRVYPRRPIVGVNLLVSGRNVGETTDEDVYLQSLKDLLRVWEVVIFDCRQPPSPSSLAPVDQRCLRGSVPCWIWHSSQEREDFLLRCEQVRGKLFCLFSDDPEGADAHLLDIASMLKKHGFARLCVILGGWYSIVNEIHRTKLENHLFVSRESLTSRGLSSRSFALNTETVEQVKETWSIFTTAAAEKGKLMKDSLKSFWEEHEKRKTSPLQISEAAAPSSDFSQKRDAAFTTMKEQWAIFTTAAVQTGRDMSESLKKATRESSTQPKTTGLPVDSAREANETMTSLNDEPPPPIVGAETPIPLSQEASTKSSPSRAVPPRESPPGRSTDDIFEIGGVSDDEFPLLEDSDGDQGMALLESDSRTDINEGDTNLMERMKQYQTEISKLRGLRRGATVDIADLQRRLGDAIVFEVFKIKQTNLKSSGILALSIPKYEFLPRYVVLCLNHILILDHPQAIASAPIIQPSTTVESSEGVNTAQGWKSFMTNFNKGVKQLQTQSRDILSAFQAATLPPELREATSCEPIVFSSEDVRSTAVKSNHQLQQLVRFSYQENMPERVSLTFRQSAAPDSLVTHSYEIPGHRAFIDTLNNKFTAFNVPFHVSVTSQHESEGS